MSSRSHHRLSMSVHRSSGGEIEPSGTGGEGPDGRRADEDLRHVRFLRWAAIALLMSWSAAGMVLLMTAC
jgi:hypothetical protein